MTINSILDPFNTINSGSSGSSKVEINSNALGLDAWGRNKTITDHSLFHGLWTYDVPVAHWTESHGTNNDMSSVSEQVNFSSGTSINGMLNVKSDTTSGNIKSITSKRHPRYQPNKGHLYSTAVNIPYPAREGYAIFGLGNKDNGVYFEVVGNGSIYGLFAVVRRDGHQVASFELGSLLPAGFDITKGHVYDIQMQWRGVGNFKFFIDLELIHTFEFLGTLSYLSTSNPALPVNFIVCNVGDVNSYELNAGCVDVTSEGGSVASRTYSSSTTGHTLRSTGTTPTAMLGYMIPETYGGRVFTRDAILTRMTSFCKDEAVHSLYISRAVNAPSVASEILANGSQGSSSLNFSQIGGNGSSLDTAFTAELSNFSEVYAARQEKDFAKVTNTPSTSSDFILGAGDIIIASIASDGNSTGGITLEFDVEV